jgi:ergothioneine biosynthesis protein EgtB
VGTQHPRPERGLLSRPSLDEVLDYRRHVDQHVLTLLQREELLDARLAETLEIGLNHEQQHQELILTDVKHLLSCNPLRPAYRSVTEPPPIEDHAPAAHGPPGWCWLPYDEGVRWIGHDGSGYSFDNERPRHREFVGAFELASRPVTCGEYLAFIEDLGSARPELWLSDGWDAVRARGWRAPEYWERRDGEWFVFTLGGPRRLRVQDPVCHVSFYEADAFARWTGARLSTEAEWELAAAQASIEGNFLESGFLHPRAARENRGGPGGPGPGGELLGVAAPSPRGGVRPQQLFGDVWEWTLSPYSPYPGYHPPRGPLGEYNGKFMCNQLVLRGGSCATPRSHIRATYRNFFPPAARWQFSGIRLARDGS